MDIGQYDSSLICSLVNVKLNMIVRDVYSNPNLGGNLMGGWSWMTVDLLSQIGPNETGQVQGQWPIRDGKRDNLSPIKNTFSRFWLISTLRCLLDKTGDGHFQPVHWWTECIQPHIYLWEKSPKNLSITPTHVYFCLLNNLNNEIIKR